MRCHLAGTLVWSQITLYKTGAPVSPPEGEIWGTEPLVRSDVAYRQITLALVTTALRRPTHTSRTQDALTRENGCEIIVQYIMPLLTSVVTQSTRENPVVRINVRQNVRSLF